MTDIKSGLNLILNKVDVNAALPKRGTAGSAGLDFFAPADGKIPAKSRSMIGLGLKMKIPEGYYLHLNPRSGLALKFGIQVLAGVIDEDYVNEVKVILYNSGDVVYDFKKGDAICQGILHPVPQMTCSIVDDKTFLQITSASERKGGFGSTDNKQ